MEWVGTPWVAGESPTTQYILVTLAVAGLQFIWSIEQAYFTLYLLDIGLTRSALSLVWVAGPVCGLIVQPVVGVLSDWCTSEHGRRRPFMVWGSFIVGAGLISFGWATEIGDKLGIDKRLVAILAVIVVDVSVNTCQACCRALIVDMFSGRRQVAANGYASRMAAIGHLVSYFLGALDLTHLGFANQIKAACVLYSIVLIVCVAVSSVSVKERRLIRNDVESEREFVGELGAVVSRLWQATRDLDPKLKAIFKVQLLAWYAWFTFLFYGSAYASEIWLRGSQNETPVVNPGEMARAGSLALAVFSLSASVWSVILPRLRKNIVDLWSTSFVVYAVAILCTAFASTYSAVLCIFAVVGFSWAATLWIPFALTAQRIHELPLSYDPNEPPDPTNVEDSLRVVLPQDPMLADLPDGHDEKSGIILGIHNSALTFPQFVSTFVSFIVFRLLDSDPQNPHEDGGHAIAVSMQLGAITVLLAAIYAQRVGSC